MTVHFTGARWWKFDFHTHTPASSDYGKGPHQRAFAKYSPRDWLLDFMNAEIDCVAVTDHNTATWIDKLQTAYKDLEQEGKPTFRPLWLFPGVEITVNEGAHLLAIFDPASDASVVERLLGKVDLNPQDRDPIESCTNLSFIEVAQEIAAMGGIAVPAHADRSKGVLTLATGTSLRNIIQSPYIIAAEVNEPNILAEGIFEDRQDRWSPIIGSDSHHPSSSDNSSRIGERFTWVKMGEPSLEGLRLALIDGIPLSLSRSDQSNTNPNENTHLQLEELSISEAYRAGRNQPLYAQFSPWLSAIIGGRGTGKSTLIEMLRLAFDRHREIPAELHPELGRFARIPESKDETGALTEETELVAVIRKHDIRYRITWRPPNVAKLSQQHELGADWEPSTGTIRDRFPIRIFSQRQVLSLSTSQGALLALIDDSSYVKKSGWLARMTEIQTRYLSLKSQVRELRSKTENRTQIQGELEDISRQIEVIEASDYRSLLLNFQRRYRQDQVLKARGVEMDEAISTITNALDDISPTDLPESDFESSNSIEHEALQLLNEAITKQRDIHSGIGDLLVRFEQFVIAWKDKFESSQVVLELQQVSKRYAELERQLAEREEANPRQYGQLLQRRSLLQKQLQELDQIEVEIDARSAEAAATLERAKELRIRLYHRRNDFLSKVLKGNEFVQISVVPLGLDAFTQERSFRLALQRSDGKLAGDILSDDGSEGLLADLYRDLPLEGTARISTMTQRLHSLKSWISRIHMNDMETGGGRWFNRHIQQLLPEDIDRLHLWWPEDYIRVSYRRPDSDHWEPIDRGSPGQKSAALLAFILSYGDEPVILDQPEDDLDNELIYNLIVQQIRSSKAFRQVIVATHNANIVVNGDAEQVISMAFVKGQCVVLNSGTGCIQDSNVSNHICKVMEGGSRAFGERYRKLLKGDKHA